MQEVLSISVNEIIVQEWKRFSRQKMALEKSDSGTSPSIGLTYATQCYIH